MKLARLNRIFPGAFGGRCCEHLQYNGTLLRLCLLMQFPVFRGPLALRGIGIYTSHHPDGR